MVIFASMSIGLFIMIIALYLIRKEVLKASFFKHVKMTNYDGDQSDQIIEYVQKFEETIDEMNQSFYDIAQDLEGKYSVHEKEIDIIDGRIGELNTLTKELATLLNYQGKEIASIKEVPKSQEVSSPIAQEKPVQPRIQPTSTRLIDKRNEQDELKNEITRLKSLGMDDQQIARRLGKGVREIKMLMNFIK